MTHVAAFFATCLLLSCPIFAAQPSGVAPARIAADVSHGCADFLAQLGKKSAHVEFVRCSYLPDRQGKPLQAIYHVSGWFAARTEAYLIRAVGLNRLKRSCCQWDSPVRQFKDAKGQEFSIAMVSEETSITKRTNWRKIPVFEITVETFTENI